MKTSSSIRPVKKKKSANFTDSSVPGRKPTKKKKSAYRSVEWAAVGIDQSTYTISMAVIAKLKGSDEIRHGSISVRWERGVDYFDRLRQAAKAQELMHDLFSAAKIMPELGQVYIAVEEPVSYGHLQRKESQTIKQQCQISGAMIGALLRWGFAYVYEIQANKWRKVVADDLGITIHHTKWNPGGKSDNTGKYRAQEWVKKFHPEWDGNWPDLISHAKRGMIVRPETSKAKGIQSDDRYEAFAMAEWMRREIEKGENN